MSISILQKIEKIPNFHSNSRKITYLNYRFLSLSKCQALARFASQNRNLYFKINLK